LTHDDPDFAPEVAFEKHSEEEIRQYLIRSLETKKELRSRVEPVIRDYVAQHPGMIVFVTHTDLIREMLRIIGEMLSSADWKVNNNGYAVIKVQDGNFSVEELVDIVPRS